jgi:hypothetical protein
MTYDRWKTTEPDWLQQDQWKDTAMPPDDDHDTQPPTQAEVEAIHRELTETSDWRLDDRYNGDLYQRAAIMIARLERAWLEAMAVLRKDETGD